MNERLIKITAQLGAHEYLLQRLYMIMYGTQKMTPDQIKNTHENLRQMIRSTDWTTKDPAHAALAGGELEDAMGDFLVGLESMLKDVGLLPKT